MFLNKTRVLGVRHAILQLDIKNCRIACLTPFTPFTKRIDKSMRGKAVTSHSTPNSFGGDKVMGESRGSLDPLAGIFKGRSPLNGRGGIRTPVALTRNSVFKSDALQVSPTTFNQLHRGKRGSDPYRFVTSD